MAGSHTWQLASGFAAQRHVGQTRRDGRTPYFSHCCRLALTVAVEFRCHDAIAIASALLHDTIEDTTADYDDIADRFGPVVAECVAALTKNMLLPESQREADYDRRLAAAPWQAKLVKLADTFDNISDSLAQNRATTKPVARAERAIEIAAPSRSEHPELGVAIDAVSQLIAIAAERSG